MIKNPKKIIFLVVLVCAVGLGALFSWQYFASFSEVTVDPPNGSKITFYKMLSGEEENLKYDNTPIIETSQKATQKIKKGSYVYVVTTSTSDFKTSTIPITIGGEPVSITPKLELSDAKLAAIAQSERENIKGTLLSKYPDSMLHYSVDKISAYGDGTWVGVSLTPKSPDFDTMVAVFNRQQGQLKLVTVPSIVLSKPVYPDIPIDVLSATNRLVQTF
jgi:hypothetical protein